MPDHELKITTPSDREIEFTRHFDAPRELVWRAHTECEYLRQWLLGPDGWRLEVCEMDLRVGGRYRWVWRKEVGEEMGMGGEHRELDAPGRMVRTELFDEDWTGGETVCTMVLSEAEGGTTMLLTVLYSSQEARDGAMATGMEQGMAISYDRLDDLLAGMGEGGA